MNKKYLSTLKVCWLLMISNDFIIITEADFAVKNRSLPVNDPFESLKLSQYAGDYRVHKSCHTVMCEIHANSLRLSSDFDIMEIASGHMCTQLIIRNTLSDGRADLKYLQDTNLLEQVQHIRKVQPHLEIIANIYDPLSADISLEDYFYKSGKQDQLVKSVVKLMKIFNFTGIQLRFKLDKRSNSKGYKKFASSLNGFLKIFSDLSQVNHWTFDGVFRPPYIDAIKQGLVGEIQKHFRYLILGVKEQNDVVSHSFPLRGDEASLETVINSLDVAGIDKDGIGVELPFDADVYVPEGNSTFDSNDTELLGIQGELLTTSNNVVTQKFTDICRNLFSNDDGNWTLYDDTEAHSMFLFNSTQWISTETTSTLAEKVGYLMSRGITRFAINDINDDDYLGKECGVKFPLLKSVLHTVISNTNCTVSPIYEPETITSGHTENDSTCSVFILVSVSLGSIGIFIIVTGIMYFLYKCLRKKMGIKNAQSNHKSEIIGGQLQAYTNEEIAELEVPPHEFQMYPDLVLGYGQFNIVLKGKILNDNVAVKMPKRNTSMNQTIQQQWNEIEIIKLLGGHKNILGLLGISTKLIEKGYIYQFLEFCPLGSLDKYLKANRERFINFFPDDELSTANRKTKMLSMLPGFGRTNPNLNFNTKTLISWAHQICDGMEFISEKNIVHGDLAARNLLLQTPEKVKICDFGLSRKLDSPETVVHNERIQGTSKDAIPWRWLPYETLDKGTISLTSDVWSFGVTVWEIFSLGEVPYAGLEWNSNFLKQLKVGLRLQSPRYATSEMYKSFMLPCWELDSEDRPSFPTIKANISHCIQSTFSNGYEDVERTTKRNTYEENVFMKQTSQVQNQDFNQATNI